MGVVCAPSHNLMQAVVQSKMLTPRDLDGQRMIAFEKHLPVRREIQKYLKQHGSTPETTDCFDNIDTIKGALAVTGAFSILPLRTVAREVEMGTLAAAALDPLLARPMGVIHDKRHANGAFSPSVQAFLDHLRELGPEMALGARSTHGAPPASSASTTSANLPDAPGRPRGAAIDSAATSTSTGVVGG